MGWQEYFQRRPIGWREDNRSAVIAMSFGGGKINPEDLFDSLRVIRKESSERKPEKHLAEKIFDRFLTKFTEKDSAEMLRGKND